MRKFPTLSLQQQQHWYLVVNLWQQLIEGTESNEFNIQSIKKNIKCILKP